MKKTYNNIIDSFRWFADNHYQLNGFIDNHPLEANKSEGVDYPLLAIYPGISNINGNEMILNFNVFIFDLLESDYSNEREILSDNLLIANDFINYYARSEEQLGFYVDETTVTMEPFAENFESSEDTNIEDDVAGWYLDVNIHLDNTMNNCNIPMLYVDSESLYATRLYTSKPEVGKESGFVRNEYGMISPDNTKLDALYEDGTDYIVIKLKGENEEYIQDGVTLKVDDNTIDDFIWDGDKLITESQHPDTFINGNIQTIEINY